MESSTSPLSVRCQIAESGKRLELEEYVTDTFIDYQKQVYALPVSPYSLGRIRWYVSLVDPGDGASEVIGSGTVG